MGRDGKRAMHAMFRAGGDDSGLAAHNAGGGLGGLYPGRLNTCGIGPSSFGSSFSLVFGAVMGPSNSLT